MEVAVSCIMEWQTFA